MEELTYTSCKGRPDLFRDQLKQETVKTWFDIGLLLDRLKNYRPPLTCAESEFSDFRENLAEGVAFITFDLGIDGVSIEAEKYARGLERILNPDDGDSLHFLAVNIKESYKEIFPSHWKYQKIPDADCFSDSEIYRTMFHKQLQRGSADYNSLSRNVWRETKEIATFLADYVSLHKIELLFPVNILSNPGSLPLALAVVLVAEMMQLCVFNSNHDFYWEDGKPPWKYSKGESPGCRDHFHTNSHIGEIFSLIETLYPWDSPAFFHTTINRLQMDTLISKKGICPNNVQVIQTAIDLRHFKSRTEVERYETLTSLERMFRGQNIDLLSDSVTSFQKECRENYHRLPEYLSRPVLLSRSKHQIHRFRYANLLLLQPTRILRRKKIEFNFELIGALFDFGEFVDFFRRHPQLHLTLMVTGPLAVGQSEYFMEFLDEFRALLDKVNSDFRHRIFLALKFGQNIKSNPVHIAEIYSASHLITIPSDTEGRGLPLIEGAASGIPVLCKQFNPKEVFNEVTGVNLQDLLRFHFCDFTQNGLSPDVLKSISCYLTEPADCLEDLVHNRKVAHRRFSYASLDSQIESYLKLIWKNCRSMVGAGTDTREIFKEFATSQCKETVRDLCPSGQQSYLPGYHRLEHLNYLKSLIDPSYFRTEEREFQGRVYDYCAKLLRLVDGKIPVNRIQLFKFYSSVRNLFYYHDGEKSTIEDHSHTFRHRFFRHYPYRDRTEQEINGIAAMLFRKIVSPEFRPSLNLASEGIFKDFHGLIHSILGGRRLGIDNTSSLERDLKANKPVAWFTGINFAREARLVVLCTLKMRLCIDTGSDITEADLSRSRIKNIRPVTLFVRRLPSDKNTTYDAVTEWLEKHASNNLRLLHQMGLFQVVATELLSPGTNLSEAGTAAARRIREIHETGGFAVCFGDEHFPTLDGFIMDTYHVGVCRHKLSRFFMGIRPDESFVFFNPGGIRTLLGYPVPVQTPREFDQALQSFEGNKYQLLRDYRQDSLDHNNTLREFTEKRTEESRKTSSCTGIRQLKGLHKDGSPWTGAQVETAGKGMSFRLLLAQSKAQPVADLVENNRKISGSIPALAWNGGYILNPELVGKLGLGEQYIGTPLGLVIAESRIISPPLFHKPAILFDQNNNIRIQRISAGPGTVIKIGTKVFRFEKDQINPDSFTSPGLFNLMYKRETLDATEGTVLRLAGCKILERIDNPTTPVAILPVGLTLWIPESQTEQSWQPGSCVEFEIPDAGTSVVSAIEAGPLLVEEGKISIDMEKEGWKTGHSVASQASRLDYTHMRGPKIGAGIRKSGELIVVAINGRIRESVGATHHDLAEILVQQGAITGMGFDPGGSVTLLANGRQLNISPYNKNYERNPVCMSPEPRFVGSAIAAYHESHQNSALH